jgi:SIR2-like domain
MADEVRGADHVVGGLSEVAQFVAIRRDAMTPKDEMIKIVKAAQPPDFGDESDVHGVLARLNLPIYLTTNYDDFMVRALTLHNKKPQQDFCRWNDYLKRKVTPSPAPAVEPSADEPLVFHLHGHTGERFSLVLTDDDYLSFLATAARDDVLPGIVGPAGVDGDDPALRRLPAVRLDLPRVVPRAAASPGQEPREPAHRGATRSR